MGITLPKFNLEGIEQNTKQALNSLLNGLKQENDLLDNINNNINIINTNVTSIVSNVNTLISYEKYYLLTQYIGGQTYNGVTLNVTTTNGTLIRGVFIPYQTIDGAWRLKFNIVFTYSPSVGSSTITITGITTKNISNYHQSISWQYPGGASTGQAYFDPGASTAQIKVSGTGYSELGISGDIELDSKPTWVY